MWTAKKIEKGIASGQMWVRVAYVDDSGLAPFEETYRAEVIADGWPDSIVLDRMATLNTFDITKLSLGAPQAVTPPPDNPPSALTLWLQSVQSYYRLQRLLALGLAQQPDVDAALKTVQSSYDPSFAGFA